MSGETAKKLRYMKSFLGRQLVHCNLQILYTCNFKCRICDFWKKPYTEYPRLSLEQVRTIAEKIKALGPQIISIGGGEPLMHEDLVDIAATLSENNFPVMICNGWFMTPEKARELWKAGLYEVSISVDYADAKKHDEQRGRQGAYERALAALRYLHENRVHPWQRVHMITVVMDDNLEELEKLIRIAEGIGITHLVTFYSHHRGRKARRSGEANIGSSLLDLKKRFPSFVPPRGYLEKFTQAVDGGVHPCYAGKNLYNIDCQGNVTLCIDRLEDRAGNILTDDIGVLRDNLLAMHRTNSCADCWTSCRGSIETYMYGNNRLLNLYDGYQVTKPVPLLKAAPGAQLPAE